MTRVGSNIEHELLELLTRDRVVFIVISALVVGLVLEISIIRVSGFENVPDIPTNVKIFTALELLCLFSQIIILNFVHRKVRYLKFRNTLKGFSSKTLAKRLKELDKSGILERQAYNEIPPRVEYRLTKKGQELVESVIYLLNWMRKWAKN
jgi:DNA-binding HxlR family transcriptional regulator